MARKKKEAVEQGPVQGKWDLPAGWEWKRLGEVLPLSYGKALPAQRRVVGFTPVYGSSGAVGTHNESITSGPTLIVGRKGNAGSVALSYKPCWVIDTAYYVVVESTKVATFWLYYLSFLNLGKLDQSTAIPSLSRDTYSVLILAVPPDSIKLRIVERIDSLFADLDKAEETLRHTLTLCEQYKQSLLKAAVTGELSKEWRKANPPKETGEQFLQRILKERRAAWEKAELAKMAAKGQKPTNDNWKKKYKEPQMPATNGLPTLPEGWTWASMEQLTTIITSGSRGWADYYAESGAIFIRAQDIKTDSLILDNIAYVLLPNNLEGMRTRVFVNDILITITGANVTKTALVQDKLAEAYVSQHVALCRPVLSVLAAYLYLWVICPAEGRKKLVSLAYGAGKPGLSLEDIRSLVIPLPSIGEQDEITRAIDNILNLCEVTFSCEHTLQRCAALRQSILKQAFTGQLI